MLVTISPCTALTNPFFLNSLNLFQAWPFAFQHGGSLSCGISQRWSVNQNDAQSCRNNNSRENNHNENYTQEYSENDYDERGFEDTNGEQTQYCNYGYKENYYEMRNSHSSENLMNNV